MSMDNNLKLKTPTNEQNLSYNRIKKNRAFRSEKKFTQESLKPSIRQNRSSLRTELRALIQQVPCDQSTLVGCIDELRQKLQQLKFFPYRKQSQPLQQYQFSNPKQAENTTRKPRYKTNVEGSSQRVIYKSVSLTNQKKTVDPRGLMDLQEMRNQIKRRKQTSGQKRIPTQKQIYGYQDENENNRLGKISQYKRKAVSQSSNVKFRANTEEVLRSQRYPARIYHYSLKKGIVQSVQLKDSRAYSHSIKRNATQNNSSLKSFPIKEVIPSSILKETPIIDNNEKIGDLSTIVKQKETLNFLGDSCVGIKQQLSPRKPDPHSSKLLEFIDWRTNELKNAFADGKQKKKRKAGLDKLSKIFPKGFFV